MDSLWLWHLQKRRLDSCFFRAFWRHNTPNSRFPACWQHSLHTSAQPQRRVSIFLYRDIVQYSPAVSQVYRIFKAIHINQIEWYRGACGTEPYGHRNSPENPLCSPGSVNQPSFWAILGWSPLSPHQRKKNPPPHPQTPKHTQTT